MQVFFRSLDITHTYVILITVVVDDDGVDITHARIVPETMKTHSAEALTSL